MVANNLKEFNNEWILFGLLFFCFMIFTISFMLANNPDNGLGNTEDKFNTYASDSQSRLVAMKNTTNTLLDISAQNNPEVSDQGSKDSVATSFGIFGNAKGFFTSISIFLGWMFTGTTGQILIAIFVGMFGLTALYFITKWVRTGS